jgi:tetratricopeptide (TPR) repeat protein
MDNVVELLSAALQSGASDALPRLREAVTARRSEAGDHARWGRLCEAAGEARLALTEYQLALRDDPDDVVALSRLATLYEERGEPDHALECAERWVRAAPGDAEAVDRLLELLLAAERFERAREVLGGPEGESLEAGPRAAWTARLKAQAAAEADEEEAAPLGMPTDSDVVRFLHLFAGRENVYARQWAAEGGEGGYSPVREPLTMTAVRNHLLGNITVGSYPVRLDNTVTFFALDVDIKKAALARARTNVAEARRIKDAVARDAERLLAELSALGVASLLEDSGFKGRHLWVFLETPEDAAVVRQFGGLFLRACPLESPDLQVELFPKQASTAGGIGNLIKLPLGIHRRTGRRSRLLTAEGIAVADPYACLRVQPRIGRETLYAAITALKARQPPAEAAPPPPETADAAAPTPGEATIREAFPVAPPVWTAADFDTHREIGHLFRACAVLGALRRKVEEHRRLTHDEQVVLAHSLGHSGSGVLAVNYLLDACVDVPATARLQSPLAGNPISCPKIRKRIPQITGAVACHCPFPPAPGQYPTPRLHLAALPAASPVEPTAARSSPIAPPPWDPVERVRTLRILRIRQQELTAEIGQVETELAAYLEHAPTPEIALEDGTLRLVHETGAPSVLVWEGKNRDRGDEEP